MEILMLWSTLYLCVVCLWIQYPGTQCDLQSVCIADNFEGRCPDHSAIIMESALYGRMRLGKCIEVDLGYMGCQNDVLYLADRWCSGRQECTIVVPNQDLKAANTECNVRGLTPYMEVEYSCVTISSAGGQGCSSPTQVHIHGNEGYLSSQVTAETRCGSPRVPWIIEVSPGQTVNMWLLDFGALGRHENTLGLGCQQSLGNIVERNLGSNFTICGDQERRKKLYTSKTNKVELSLITRFPADDNPVFMIEYKVIGCSDLSPPAHAWYKREGNEAVIGCKSNDRVWRLYCNGNTWDGVVGNCSVSKDNAGTPNLGIDLPFSSVIFLTCVVCGAILLIIVVVVAGAVYVKKQSIRHEIKLRSDYACTTLQSAQYFPAKTLGYDVMLDRSMTRAHNIPDNQPLVQISDKTLSCDENPGHLTLSQNCSCSTVPRGEKERIISN